jgi:hypothetical protein
VSLFQTTIQIVRLHERDVLAEQIAHRAMFEPMPVQSPFAARRNQLVADQRLQDVQPARSFARGRQWRAANVREMSGVRHLLPEGEWCWLDIWEVQDARLRDGPWHTGQSHKKPDSCIDRVAIEVRF